MAKGVCRTNLIAFLKICKVVFLREGPCSHGASWAICGSGVPPYDLLNLYGVFNSRFSASVSQKLLELKSLKRQTKAEEEGTLGSELLSLRLSLKAL